MRYPHLSRRAIVAVGASAALLTGGLTTALAATPISAPATPAATPQQQSLPVGVVVTRDGSSVGVGVTFQQQPVVGGSVGNGRACVGVGEGVPFCANVPGVTIK